MEGIPRTSQPSGAPPAHIASELQRLYEVLRTQPAADALWDRVLSPGERERLGDDVSGGAAELWMRLHGCSLARAVIEAAWHIDLITAAKRERLLEAISEVAATAETTLQYAIAQADLVLIESRRSVYWRGKVIEIDWARFPKVWEYFWILCNAAKAGTHVDASNFGNSRKPDYHVKMKSRLTGMKDFPPDLACEIHSDKGGKQKLLIKAERIRIFQVEAHEVLREVF